VGNSICQPLRNSDYHFHYIKASTAAYRSEQVNYDFYSNFIEDADKYPGYAIVESNGDTIGFCTLEAFMPIETFREVAEVMYFIHKEYTNKGIGKLALHKLEEDAKHIGIKKIVVNISDDNQRSIEFHKRNGFIEYGRLENIGRKINKDFGIVYMVKDIL